MARRKKLKLRRNYYHYRWKNVPTVRDFDFLYSFIGISIFGFLYYYKDTVIPILKISGYVLLGILLLYIAWKIYQKFKKEDYYTYTTTKKETPKNNVSLTPVSYTVTHQSIEKIIIPHKYESGSIISQLERLGWREFEFFVAEIFKKKGYSTEVGPGKEDEGVDVCAWKHNEMILIQCKKWKSDGAYIGVKDIREFFGVVASHKGSQGLYVTTTGLTQSAKDFIEKNNINVWSKYNLEEKIREVFQPGDTITIQIKSTDQQMSQQLFCSECGCEMVLKTAKRGENAGNQFYGCTGFPNCRNTEKI